MAGDKAQIVAALTSATSAQGAVIASSQYVGGGEAWQLFGAGNGWLSGAGAALPHWVGFSFAAGAKSVKGYAVAPWDADNFPSRCPAAWQFQGSNDGANWQTLHEVTGVTNWAVGVEKVYTLPVAANFSAFRLFVTANNGNAYTGARRLRLISEALQLWAVDGFGERVRVS
jgi:hypothetical protein